MRFSEPSSDKKIREAENHLMSESQNMRKMCLRLNGSDQREALDFAEELLIREKRNQNEKHS